MELGLLIQLSTDILFLDIDDPMNQLSVLTNEIPCVSAV